MKTLGESLRDLRKSRQLLIRQVASDLNIDPSLLSRIERGDKYPTRAQVVQLSGILRTSEEELMACYLSERVMRLPKGEPLALKAVVMAEKWMTLTRKSI